MGKFPPSCSGFDYGSSASYIPYTASNVSYVDLVSKKTNIQKLFKEKHYKNTWNTTPEIMPQQKKDFTLLKCSLFLLSIIVVGYVVSMLIFNL